jgi:hypothetical protein
VANSAPGRAMSSASGHVQHEPPAVEKVEDEVADASLYERNRLRTHAKIDAAYVALAEDHAKFRKEWESSSDEDRPWKYKSWDESPDVWKRHDWKRNDASAGWKKPEASDDWKSHEPTERWHTPLPDYVLGDWWAV